MLTDHSIAVILGTRPELVKLAPLIHELGDAARLIHTGQHWDDSLSGQFIEELRLPVPELLAGVGGRSRATQVGSALQQLDALFAEDTPAAVVVQGDTNATLAGAMAANAHGIPLVHVEAGLRSHDRAMPEEHNRVMVDALADVLCAATEDNRANLLAESVPEARIAVTGNTVVEVVRDSLPAEAEQHTLLTAHSLRPGAYVLATVHRPENTDDPDALRRLVQALREIAARGTPVVVPLHPRTAAAAARHDVSLDRLTVIEPLGYAEFLTLARHAALLVSDSGGVQEECTVLGRPLLVVRRSTERPEAAEAGFAKLVEPGPELAGTALRWLSDGEERLSRLARTSSPYGDGLASARIAGILAALTEQHAAPALQAA